MFVKNFISEFQFGTLCKSAGRELHSVKAQYIASDRFEIRSITVGLAGARPKCTIEFTYYSETERLDLNRLSFWTSVFCTYYRELRTIECTYYREMTVQYVSVIAWVFDF